jgi:hypothetical protein
MMGPAQFGNYALSIPNRRPGFFILYPPPPQDFVKRKKQEAKAQLKAINYPVFELID